MDQATHIEMPVVTSEWRRTTCELPVTFVWAYDTTAILPDYYDSETGTLPAGQFIMFSEVAEDPGHYLCDLDDPSFVESVSLPTGRIQRFRPWCFATRLQAVLEADHYRTLTTAADRPSWLRRLFRRITR